MTPTQREAALRLADDMNTPISVWADHVAHLLRELAKTDDDVLDVRENDNKRVISAIEDAWTKGFRTGQQAEPDMRHPKIQALIGSNARYQIELSLVEQLLEDPEFETTSMDMEYWLPLHDKLKAALTDGEPRIDNYPLYSGLPPLPQCEPVAWMVTNVDGQDAYVTADPTLANSAQRALPLYTAPVQDTRACTCHPDDNPPTPCPRKYALGECREAAKAAPVQEPFCYLRQTSSDKHPPHGWAVHFIPLEGDVPLYAHPQQCQPLTKVQITELAEQCGYDGAVPTVRLAFQGFKLDDFARAIERAHGIGEAP